MLSILSLYRADSRKTKVRYIGGEILNAYNQTSRTYTCPRASLSTINPTWTTQGSNQGLLTQRLTINYLSYCTANLCNNTATK
jgi:hypothetical protein